MAGVPLITGATGFAGSHLLQRLASQGVSAHAWAHRASGRTTPASDARVTWAAIDLLDRGAVRDALEDARPAVIYHFAGAANVQDAWRDPARALQINVIGTHNLLSAVRELGLDCRVLVTGSALVYKPQLVALTESSPIGTPTPYGVSKLAQELVAAESGVPVVLARPFNHAGPGQSPAFATSAFAQQIAEIEAGRRDPVLHVGNLDAERDITDVRDTVRAYEALVARGRTGRPYNVCTGRAYKMGALLDILLSRARARVSVAVDPSRLRPSDNPVVLGSHARLTEDTGWVPEIPIERTLEDLLDAWRSAVQVAG